MRVLVVEDDEMIGEAVCTALGAAAHASDWVRNGADARTALDTQSYDAVLLDLGLPDADGVCLIEAMRAGGSGLPVIVISARDQVPDRVHVLDVGADDYLVKPFDIDELLARLRASQRRTHGQAQAVLKRGAVEIDTAKRMVRLRGEPVTLSVREYQLLLALMERCGEVLSRTQIEEAVYAWSDEIGSNAVEVYIHHLRRKLGDGMIRTVRGHGYVFEPAKAV